LQSFCKITMTFILIPFLIAPSSLSSCNGKQFGVLRHAVDLARTKELERRNPNKPHIEVML
jgi:hypothetical protein